MSEIDYQWFVSRAADPADALTQVFAGMLQSASRNGLPPQQAMGMPEDRFSALLERYFPAANGVLAADGEAGACCAALRDQEIGDLVDLLLAHAGTPSIETEWVAYAVAVGCMGENHLYQDMGFSERQALSDLLQEHFPALCAKNVGNMKWKKFFYKQLCERAEVNLCKAPSCQVCIDFDKCFGSEDDSGLSALANLGARTPQAKQEDRLQPQDWNRGLPDDYSGAVVMPVRFERFEEPSALAERVFGYDGENQCSYYRHRHTLTREVLDDEDNFYSERAYSEEVLAWRLASGVWLRCSATAGGAGECRDRRLEYAITPVRPS